MKYKIIVSVFVFVIASLLCGVSHTQAKTVELVKNGNFEQQSAYWEGSTWSIIFDGSSGMNGTWFAFIGYDNIIDGIYQADIALPINATNIRMEFDYKYWDDRDFVGGYGAITLHDDNEIVDSIFFDELDDTGLNMRYVDVDITHLKGKTVHLLAAVNNEGGYSNRFLVDNFTITATIPESAKTPIYRLYNKKTGTQLYTKGESDRDKILNKWNDFEFTDGAPAFYASTSNDGNTPMYRLYNTKTGAQLYTKGEADRDKVLNKWSDFEFTDGVPSFYAAMTPNIGLTPIFRLYNTKTGMHLYTKGIADRDKILNKWSDFEFTDGSPAFYASITS